MTTLSAAPNDVAAFILNDNRKCLFPLECVALIAQHGATKLHEFVVGRMFAQKGPAESFLTCPIDYANKDFVHLRKAMVLDPLATYFLYAFVLANKSLFKRRINPARQVYGYGFSGGKPIDSFEDYHKLRKRKYQLLAKYKYSAHVDIANCFNSFYHHDVEASIESELGLESGQQIGKFLREINAGESINCFPQGSYPAKTIGSWFLRFIEQSAELRSKVIVRYIDDILFCDDHSSTVASDVHKLQVVLGTHSLCLNAEKTVIGEGADAFIEKQVDDIKKRLLKKRELLAGYDEDNADAEDVEEQLDEEEIEYIRTKIADRTVAEEDVELALTLVKEDTSIQLKLVELILAQFPHLLKALHHALRDIDDKEEVWSALRRNVKDVAISSHELFWSVRMILDNFEWGATLAKTLSAALDHPSCTPVVQAAILEYGGLGHGFDEIKQGFVKTQSNTIVGIASACGLRKLPSGKRNQIYKYAAKSGPHARLYYEILSGM